MIEYFAKLSFLKRFISSIGKRTLKILGKNRGYFNINGIYFFLDFLDPIDREIIINKKYEHDQVMFIENEMKKNLFSYFLDIGSNSGYYSFYFANKFKNLKILSFEPNFEAFYKLKKTLKKNSFNNIKIFNFGLSNKKTNVYMKSMIKNGFVHSNSSILNNLREFKDKNFKIFESNLRVGDHEIKLKNKRLLIKIDVEGHEIFVLKGLIKNLNQNKCLILIEIGDNKFNKVNNFMIKNHFKLLFKSKLRSDYVYSNLNDKMN